VVEGESPVILLVNAPAPVPSFVLVDKATVGLALVPQTTPFAETVGSPSAVTFPPLLAVVVMELAVVVVTVASVPVLILSVAAELPDALKAVMV
jgi:hypothetical protein